MKKLARILTLAFSVFLFSQALHGAEEWTQQAFSATADEVYTAAKKVIGQHHEIKSKDDAARTVRFHIGMTAWSWGYDGDLKIEPDRERTSVGRVTIARSGGKALSWGSGQKEIKKIWRWISDELNKHTPGKDTKGQK